MRIAYTAGVFDLFHIGHLTLLNNIKKQCDRLIVGVTTDELATARGKNVYIPFEERIEIVANIKCVDGVVPQDNMDKIAVCKKIGASILAVGDDWKGSLQWQQYELEAIKNNIEVVYFPYTKETSSTKIRLKLEKDA